jgi:hypothetical protein
MGPRPTGQRIETSRRHLQSVVLIVLVFPFPIHEHPYLRFGMNRVQVFMWMHCILWFYVMS